MSILSSLFGKDPKDSVIKPGQFADLYRQERQGATPNVNNQFGSSSVTWDGDQATVNQTLSPEMQAIASQMMGNLAQGPRQLGTYSNPFIQGLLNNVSGGIAARQGLAQPQMNMGGYQQMQPQNGLPMVDNGQQPTVQPAAQPMNGAMPVGPYQRTEQWNQGGGGMGSTGGGSMGSQLGQLLGDWQMMNEQYPSQPFNLRK